jgi:hypothetical protein
LKLSFGDQLAVVGLFLALLGTAIAILWSTKRWLGWVFLIAAILVLLGWGWINGWNLTWIMNLSRQHLIVSTLIVAVAGGLVCGFLWVRLVNLARKPSTSVKSTTDLAVRSYLAASAPYRDGLKLGEVPWRHAYIDVRLDCSSGPNDLLDVDTEVSLDTRIGKIGQITEFPGVTFFPPDSEITPLSLEGTDANGKQIAVPIIIKPSTPGFYSSYQFIVKGSSQTQRCA